MAREQTPAPAPEAPVGDRAAELRLGCLKAALEVRYPGMSTEQLLALAEQFHAWTKGVPPKS